MAIYKPKRKIDGNGNSEDIYFDKSSIDGLESSLNGKLTSNNIIAGTNITLNKDGGNVTINSSGGGSGGGLIPFTVFEGNVTEEEMLGPNKKNYSYTFPIPDNMPAVDSANNYLEFKVEMSNFDVNGVELTYKFIPYQYTNAVIEGENVRICAYAGDINKQLINGTYEAPGEHWFELRLLSGTGAALSYGNYFGEIERGIRLDVFGNENFPHYKQNGFFATQRHKGNSFGMEVNQDQDVELKMIYTIKKITLWYIPL